jgi:hypothetical protein
MVAPVNSDLTRSSGSSSSSDFLADIRRLRSRGEARAAARNERKTRARQAALSGHLRALECLDTITGRIEVLAREFVTEAPGFHSVKRFFDGRYMVELRGETSARDESGESRRELSRLAFLISLGDGQTVLIESHATARDRDLSINRVETSLCDEPGTKAVNDFLDEQFLVFARAFYSPDRASPILPA